MEAHRVTYQLTDSFTLFYAKLHIYLYNHNRQNRVKIPVFEVKINLRF